MEPPLPFSFTSSISFLNSCIALTMHIWVTVRHLSRPSLSMSIPLTYSIYSLFLLFSFAPQTDKKIFLETLTFTSTFGHLYVFGFSSNLSFYWIPPYLLIQTFFCFSSFVEMKISIPGPWERILPRENHCTQKSQWRRLSPSPQKIRQWPKQKNKRS